SWCRAEPNPLWLLDPSETGRASQGVPSEGCPLFGEHDFKADVHLVHGSTSKAGTCRHLRDLFLRIGAWYEEKAERDPHEPGVEPVVSRFLDVGIDVLHGRLFSQVDDDGASTRLQHTVHLIDGFEGLGEVLERGAADDQIEGPVSKRHRGGVPMTEMDWDQGFLRVCPGNLDKGVTDVQSRDGVLTAFGQLNGQVAWPGSHLKNVAVGGGFLRKPLREPPECRDIFPGVLGVPPGDPALHPNAL